MEYRFLIVDDDHQSRDVMSGLINEFLPTAVVLETVNGMAALPLLAAGDFDVLLLTVGLDGHDGFKLLEALPTRNFELVFVSKSPELAVDAIKEGASDYLLKPIKRNDFRDMLQKIIERRSRYLAYQEYATEDRSYLHQKISIPHQQGLWFITLKDIIYLKADNSYTTIYTTNGEKITTSRPISRFENTLEIPWFFRIHKSYLINTSQFTAYLSRNGDIAIMSNGDKLMISRYRLSKFLEVMKEIGGVVKI